MTIQERHVTIRAVMESIEEACAFVNGQARAANLSEEAVYHCHLSVEEVLTNIIEHGYKFKGYNRTIKLICENFSNRFVITTVDDAPAFNPLSLPDPDPKTPLIEREGGGWGIYFVKKYMDHVRYELRDGHNCFTIEKVTGFR